MDLELQSETRICYNAWVWIWKGGGVYFYAETISDAHKKISKYKALYKKNGHIIEETGIDAVCAVCESGNDKKCPNCRGKMPAKNIETNRLIRRTECQNTEKPLIF